jgi:hypothetical protein
MGGGKEADLEQRLPFQEYGVSDLIFKDLRHGSL